MSQMSMNRVIHGAVRRDLDRFATALGSFPSGDHQRARSLGEAWDFFALMLDLHHEGEHEFVWPTMENLGVERELLTSLDGEHEAMAQALAQTTSAMGTLRETATAESAAAAEGAVGVLTEVTATHLDHEEQQLESVFLTHEGSPELKAMSAELRKHSKEHAGDFFAWLEEGASAEEKAGLRALIPGPVLFMITRIGGRKYRAGIAPVWAA